ncbi:hypothetical protein C1646_776264 [Rhizophagus diaphanus]|nr:hypothetical protein C1646_776264 [Rhizophagus diaphanus] [Rhizophagus sp. MUCL 43196]
MGLCGEVDNIDETKIYGVLPYVAPEVLRGKPYTQAADIYSFDICKGISPEISESEAPSCYIDIMKKCWNLDKDDRPNISEIDKFITLFYESYFGELYIVENQEIEIQFRQAKEYRRANLLSTENYQIVTHPQAIYTSRLLNPFTKDLPKNDNDYNSQSLDDCALPISFK